MVRGVRRQVQWKVSVILDSTDRSEAKVFRAHAPPQCVCESLVCALKLLANQQLGGDILELVLVEGLQERSGLKMVGELRSLIPASRGGESRRLGKGLDGAS